MNSICIFAHFNKNNSLEDYVINYLKTMRNLVDEIIFISTSDLTSDKKNLLNQIVNKIIIKENKGYDFGSWREGLLLIKNNYNKLPKEIILCNDSCYISKKLLTKAILNMRGNRRLDFWGITKNHSVKTHIQSYFMAFNSKPLRDKNLWNLINNWEHQYKKTEYIGRYEIGLTDFFVKNKYNIGCYINISRIRVTLFFAKNTFKLIIDFLKKVIRVYFYRFLKKYNSNKVIKGQTNLRKEYFHSRHVERLIGIFNIFWAPFNLTITHLDLNDQIKINLPVLKVSKVENILKKDSLKDLKKICTKNGFNFRNIINHQKNLKII